MKFRKKPVIIEAIQFLDSEGDGGNSDEVAKFLGDNLSGFSDTEVHYKNTPHGTILSTYLGEWIIKGSEPGDFYPCKSDIFKMTYEAVE